MDKESIEKITIMETQIKTIASLVRWLGGGLGALILLLGGSLGSWIYAQSNDVTNLKQTVIAQEKTSTRHEAWLKSNSDKTDSTLTNVTALQKDVQYNGKTLDEIKKMVEKIYKNRG